MKTIWIVLVLTHDHLDHTDPETLERYLTTYDSITVLASLNAWNKVRSFGGNHNYVMFLKTFLPGLTCCFFL